jgi:outer membrane protein assembly factor BamD
MGLAITVLLSACATPKPRTSEEYFESAESLFREGAFSMAIENYRDMIDQYPFGEHTEEAELRIAHAHFLNQSYIEAIAAFTDFQRRHPTSPYLPLVGYELGMAYKLQMGTIDRDQSAARNADLYFATVVAQYADSPYAELARQELAECRNSMAEHELYVARFYYGRGNFPALESRALEIVSRFPGTTAADEALLALGRLYEESDDPRRAAMAYAALAQDHPLSPRATDAEEALQRLTISREEIGPAPREALLAATGYTSSRSGGEAIEVPGIQGDTRAFAPPPGVGMPPLPSAGQADRGSRGY